MSIEAEIKEFFSPTTDFADPWRTLLEDLRSIGFDFGDDLWLEYVAFDMACLVGRVIAESREMERLPELAARYSRTVVKAAKYSARREEESTKC